MAGVSNVAIKKFFKNENEDIKKNFTGVYSSFSNKPGTHWCSFLNIYPKTQLLLFDRKRFQGFKYFIADNDYSTINKLLYNLDKFNKKDNNLSLASLKFSVETYPKLKEREISKLTDTAKDFFHLLAELARVNNLSKEMTVLMLVDVIQEIYSDTCGLFQRYFYKNLFDPDENSKILNDEHLTKKTIETLSNEIFFTNKKENEHKVTDFAEEYNILKNWVAGKGQ